MYKLYKSSIVKIIYTDRQRKWEGEIIAQLGCDLWNFFPLSFLKTWPVLCTVHTVKMGKKEYIKDIFSLLLNFYLVNEIQVLAGGIGWFGSWHLRDGWCWLENAIIMTPLVAKNASLYKLSFRSISPLLLSPLRLNQKNLRDGNN